MAHAIEIPTGNPALAAHPNMEFQIGVYKYSVVYRDGQAMYSVSDGTRKVTVPLLWPFGRNSQTYLLERDGKFYESMVSFYPGANGLDRTMGDQDLKPATIDEAAGRLLSTYEARNCFACHATGSTVRGQLNISAAKRGVTCDRCHVDTDRHLDAFNRGQAAVIPESLRNRSAEEISNVCGQCHRTWQTVIKNRWFGVVNVRFQPYRLAISKCYDGVDRRMSCVACHNPHEQLVTEDRRYDTKCLACHTDGAKVSAALLAANTGVAGPQLRMKVCPVSKDNCVSCHMPKVDLPGAHKTFTDHYIRVVKPAEAYQE
jgi:mono/diheme cytochrome c family protein